MIDGHGPIGYDRACEAYDTSSDRPNRRAIVGDDIDPPVSCPPADRREATNHGRGGWNPESRTPHGAQGGQDDENGK
jgi:hypothetical protein